MVVPYLRGLLSVQDTPPPANENMDAVFTYRELKGAPWALNYSWSLGPDRLTYSSPWLDNQSHIFNLEARKILLILRLYSPVALASCVGMLMERTIPYRLEWFMETNNLNPDVMPGFRQRRSSIDGIVDLVSSIGYLAVKHRFSGVVFLDIKGAFESISHGSNFTAVVKLVIISYLSSSSIYI